MTGTDWLIGGVVVGGGLFLAYTARQSGILATNAAKVGKTADSVNGILDSVNRVVGSAASAISGIWQFTGGQPHDSAAATSGGENAGMDWFTSWFADPPPPSAYQSNLQTGSAGAQSGYIYDSMLNFY